MTSFSAFIDREHRLYAAGDENLFLAASGELDRYSRYLEIALERHAQLSVQFGALLKGFFATPKGVSRVAPQLQSTLNAVSTLQTLIAMDHEECFNIGWSTSRDRLAAQCSVAGSIGTCAAVIG